MQQVNGFVHPQSFQDGREYMLLFGPRNGQVNELVPVKFAAYDPCPAFVIVSSELGKRWRCPRDEVFSKAGQGA